MLKTILNAFHWRISLLIVIFLLSTSWLYTLLKIGPNSFNQQQFNESASDALNDALNFPTNLNELRQVSKLLMQYSQMNRLYVIILFSSAYLYKQTFAIPGSVFMNLLSGALYGIWIGFPLCCFLTATGASFCYLLSKYCAKDYIVKYFPRRIESLKQKVDENRSTLIYVLLFLRLFPMTPNWFLNMTSPILDIPLDLFFISVFVGLMPYNYICVQSGCLLSQLESLDDVLNTNTVIKLAMIAVVALLPGILFRRRAQEKLN